MTDDEKREKEHFESIRKIEESYYHKIFMSKEAIFYILSLVIIVPLVITFILL